ncbi:MAG: type II secretion system GspH family protein [Alphaproteobacteria bacterium]|nr:type II secretion system GspH family protein [Alphaproteobacteria bacterium]
MTYLYPKNALKRIHSTRVPGFSLIELGIVLLIVGVIIGAVFKGHDLLQSAKMNSVLDDVRRYKNAILMYQHTYGEWPGDDAKASLHFANATDGNGDGLVSGDDEPLVWKHLSNAGSVSHGNPPSSKIGGKYYVTSNPSPAFQGLYVLLGQGDDGKTGLLTPKQAHMLKQKADDGKANEGILQFMEGTGAKAGDCINGDAFNLASDKPVCILAVRVS